MSKKIKVKRKTPTSTTQPKEKKARKKRKRKRRIVIKDTYSSLKDSILETSIIDFLNGDDGKKDPKVKQAHDYNYKRSNVFKYHDTFLHSISYAINKEFKIDDDIVLYNNIKKKNIRKKDKFITIYRKELASNITEAIWDEFNYIINEERTKAGKKKYSYKSYKKHIETYLEPITESDIAVISMLINHNIFILLQSKLTKKSKQDIKNDEILDKYLGCMYIPTRPTILLYKTVRGTFEPITIFRKLIPGEDRRENKPKRVIPGYGGGGGQHGGADSVAIPEHKKRCIARKWDSKNYTNMRCHKYRYDDNSYCKGHYKAYINGKSKGFGNGGILEVDANGDWLKPKKDWLRLGNFCSLDSDNPIKLPWRWLKNKREPNWNKLPSNQRKKGTPLPEGYVEPKDGDGPVYYEDIEEMGVSVVPAAAVSTEAGDSGGDGDSGRESESHSTTTSEVDDDDDIAEDIVYDDTAEVVAVATEDGGSGAGDDAGGSGAGDDAGGSGAGDDAGGSGAADDGAGAGDEDEEDIDVVPDTGSGDGDAKKVSEIADPNLLEIVKHLREKYVELYGEDGDEPSPYFHNWGPYYEKLRKQIREFDLDSIDDPDTYFLKEPVDGLCPEDAPYKIHGGGGNTLCSSEHGDDRYIFTEDDHSLDTPLAAPSPKSIDIGERFISMIEEDKDIPLKVIELSSKGSSKKFILGKRNNIYEIGDVNRLVGFLLNKPSDDDDIVNVRWIEDFDPFY